MIRRKANSRPGQALLAMAGLVFSLFMVDGALVSASRSGEAASAGLFPSVQAAAQVVFDGSVRFVNDMHAVYQLKHFDDILPAAAEPRAPKSQTKANLFLCSENRPVGSPAKSSI